jgi:transcriptional regulator with XRE-family HTH domain
MVTFTGLQEELRANLLRRIRLGELTGAEVARRSGYTQAHVWNFLNGKRGMALDGLDRVIAAIGVTLEELVQERLLRGTKERDMLHVPLVDLDTACQKEAIVEGDAQGILGVPRQFLECQRSGNVTPGRTKWTRFVVVRLAAGELPPGLAAGTSGASAVAVLIDRHYNTLVPYRGGQCNYYAVRLPNGGRIGRLVRVAGGLFVEGAELDSAPIPLDAGIDPAEVLIAGRVAALAFEA